MRGKLFFGAATAALLMFAPAALAQTADQPGDSSTTARFSGDAVEGEITAGDVDWYRMQVQQGQRYSFTLDGVTDAQGATLDPMLAIYDASGNQLAFNDDANMSLNAALSYAPQQSGEVFVEARAYGEDGTGRYRLSATSAPIPPDDAGNDTGTRARITAGRTVNGQIEYEGDVDVYRLSARTGTRYSITLTGAGASALGDPLLRVLDRDGNELAVNDDDGESLNSALEFTPESNGDVFVEARAFADAYAGGYALAIASARAPTDRLSADRNTRGRLNVGGEVSDVIDPVTDKDWYRIRLEAGQSYRFTLNSSGDNPLADPYLALMNAAGEEVAMDDDGGEGFNSYLEFTAPTTGNYFLAAQSFAGGSAGGYTLAARAGDVPSDASTDASLSAEGDYREGILSPAGDRDWFAITLAEGQGVRIGVNTLEGAEGLADPYLIVYGPDGAEVLRDDDGGDGLNAWSEFQAATGGVYHLEVRGFTDDSAGRYAVMVTAGEIGGSPDMAEYLTPGSEARVATIGTPGDVDWFVIEMIEGRPYRINLDGVEGGLTDPLLVLYDQTGQEIARDDDGGPGLNSYLTFVSPTGGPYFAAASSYDGQSTGQYSLRVTDTDVPGHVYTDEMLDQVGDERIGRIEIEGDTDTFRVDLEGGVAYTIEVRGHGDRPLADPFLAIVNEENNRLTSDDDSGPGMDARLRFTPENSGAYFLQASGLGGSTGWYQITIARQ
ncbi:MAG: hypothetical protein DCF16_10465 [Alphaproteobacteria bacterium]|nr:MAG: hypothetical protein DCF16_10465 [Alphaproteobacteria bacterium]